MGYVDSGCESAGAIIGDLHIDGGLVGSLERRTAPDSPIAPPGVVEAADRTNLTDIKTIAIGLGKGL